MPTVGTTPFYNEIILSYTIAFYGLLQYNLGSNIIVVFLTIQYYCLSLRHE